MANDLVKRFIKKDGSQRISFYREDYAENPRYNTDEPLHCEDWSREYSIMTKEDKEHKSESLLDWFRYMLERYGNREAIINVLRNNAKAETHQEGDDCLMYDASRHEWVLYSWIGGWKDYAGEHHGNCWSEEWSWCCKIKNLMLCDIVEHLSDDMIAVFADEKFFTDGIKFATYDFGYNGEVRFHDKASYTSDGIAWLEKGEFLKYSGCKEEYWERKSLDEIEFLLGELKAWGDNDVYGFVVEDAVRIQGIKTYYNGEREDEPYIDTQWEESDSCWGFYGELDKMIPYMFEETNLKQEDFEEENV